MASAKDITLKVIPSKVANAFTKRVHYSGKVVQNSQLHFGVFLDGALHGTMQFGPSLDKSKMLGLVKGTGWNEFLELNRMAFDDKLPRNSESRALSVAMRLLKKNAPHVKWIISFADGCQCGDGTIYRASGFILTGIKKNKDIFLCEDGTQIHSMTVKSSKRLLEKHGNWKAAIRAEHGEFKPIIGHQLRYIYFIDKSARKNLTVPALPFSEIGKRGAGMYKGISREPGEVAGSHQ